MGDKPKISPANTYIFEEEDIEQLDDLSLTSVMRDASQVVQQLRDEAEDPSSSLDDFEFGVLVPED
jgi:hypothetical protein